MPQTLLLADDSVTIQRVIELTFADEGIRVIAVGDGQQAVDRVTADPPDIVLADTGMPEQDGYEVATFIKNDPNLAHIPVVLLTGAFEPVDGDRATKSGCDAVLVKPFEPQEVIKRVRELLGKAAVSTAPVGIVGAESGYEAESDPGRGLPAGFEPRPRPVRNTSLDETRATPRPVPDESTESPTSSDDGDPDPVSVYLDRVDAALDLLDNDRGAVEAPGEEAGKAMDEGLALAVPSEPAEEPPDLDSLEGALSALEGALENLSLEPSAPAEEAASATSEPVAEPPSERWSASIVEPIVEPIDESIPELLEPVFAPVADAAPEAPPEPVVASIDEPASEPVEEPVAVAGAADGDDGSLPDVVSAVPQSAIDNLVSGSAKLPPLEFLHPTVAEQPPKVDVTTDGPADQAVEADQDPELAADLEADLVPDEGMRPESVVASVGPDLATVPTPVVDSWPVTEGADAPARPAPHAPVPREWEAPAQTFAAPRAASPSLADAFASLLAAEQGATAQTRTPYPWPASPRPAGADGDLVERVTDRVLARLSDTVTTELVTQIVTQVAERLLRAELDRQKP